MRTDKNSVFISSRQKSEIRYSNKLTKFLKHAQNVSNAMEHSRVIGLYISRDKCCQFTVMDSCFYSFYLSFQAVNLRFALRGSFNRSYLCLSLNKYAIPVVVIVSNCKLNLIMRHV